MRLNEILRSYAVVAIEIMILRTVFASKKRGTGINLERASTQAKIAE